MMAIFATVLVLVCFLCHPSEALETMAEIGSRTGTDKVLHHGYDRFYPFFLERWRDKAITMLEIGFLHGHSYLMWKDYFPKAAIWCMEKDGNRKEYPQLVGEMDQGNVKHLSKVLDDKQIRGQLEFIIDDGSHHPSHQEVSFRYLFEHGLKPGGVYIVEDTEMNYWRKGETYGNPTNYGKDHPDSLITKFKAFVDVVNAEYAPKDAPHVSVFGPTIDRYIGGVFFAANCVVITKSTEEEVERYWGRKYRYHNNLDGPGTKASSVLGGSLDDAVQVVDKRASAAAASWGIRGSS